jgi:hypothetical protein
VNESINQFHKIFQKKFKLEKLYEQNKESNPCQQQEDTTTGVSLILQVLIVN